MMQPGTRVRVTNLNDFSIADRYDGVPEVFEPGKSRDMDLEAAAHILGFKIDEHGTVIEYEADMAYVCRRWGWNLPTFGIPKSPEGKQVINAELAMENAARAFKNLKIEVVRYNLVEVGDRAERLPAARASAHKGGPIKVQDKPRKSGRSEEVREAARQRMKDYWVKKRAAEGGGSGTAGAAA